jgi:hypothetical protein
MQELQKEQQPDIRWESNDNKLKKKLLRQVSFRILAMESAMPNPQQEAPNEAVKQLKEIQKQLSEALEAAESTAEYFDRDELATKAYSDEIVNLVESCLFDIGEAVVYNCVFREMSERCWMDMRKDATKERKFYFPLTTFSAHHKKILN